MWWVSSERFKDSRIQGFTRMGVYHQKDQIRCGSHQKVFAHQRHGKSHFPGSLISTGILNALFEEKYCCFFCLQKNLFLLLSYRYRILLANLWFLIEILNRELHCVRNALHLTAKLLDFLFRQILEDSQKLSENLTLP